MNNFFIIVGNSGSGKSTFKKYFDKKAAMGQDFYYIKKYTTRPIRKEELTLKESEQDFKFATQKEFEKMLKAKPDLVTYRLGQYDYFMPLEQIRKSVKEHKNTCFITTDIKIIKELKQELLFDARVIVIYIYTDHSLIMERMHALNYTQQEIESRINRSRPVWNDYLDHGFQFINHTILNITTKEEYEFVIENIIKHYN